jgi:predicted RNase H-like HicB family nuclease
MVDTRTRYVAYIERIDHGFSAYSPDYPGCVAAASTIEGVKEGFRAALRAYLTDKDNECAPLPHVAFKIEGD